MTENVRSPVYFCPFLHQPSLLPRQIRSFLVLWSFRRDLSLISSSRSVSISPSSYEYVSFIYCFHASSFVVDFSCLTNKKKRIFVFGICACVCACVLFAFVLGASMDMEYALARGSCSFFGCRSCFTDKWCLRCLRLLEYKQISCCSTSDAAPMVVSHVSRAMVAISCLCSSRRCMFTDSLLLGGDLKEHVHVYDEGSSTVLSTWPPVPFCDVVVCLFAMMGRQVSALPCLS